VDHDVFVPALSRPTTRPRTPLLASKNVKLKRWLKLQKANLKRWS